MRRLLRDVLEPSDLPLDRHELLILWAELLGQLVMLLPELVKTIQPELLALFSEGGFLGLQSPQLGLRLDQRRVIAGVRQLGDDRRPEPPPRATRAPPRAPSSSGRSS